MALVGAVCKNRPGGYDCVCPDGTFQVGNQCLSAMLRMRLYCLTRLG